jgi:tetratricopeptide (TPR) repeat protein
MARQIGWFDRARSAFRLADEGKFRSAEQKQKQALRRAEKKGGKDLLYALQTTGFFYWHNNRFEKAIPAFERCLALSLESKIAEAPEYAENSAAGVAMSYNSKGELELARDFYKKALSLARTAKKAESIARYNVLVGATSVRLNDYKTAIKNYEEALASDQLDEEFRRQTEELLVMAYGSRKLYAKRDLLRKKLITEDINSFLTPSRTRELPNEVSLPQNYGGDTVSNFLLQAELSTLATFAQKKSLFEKLTQKEVQFRVMHKAVTNFIATHLNAKYPNTPVEDLQPSDEDWLEVYFFQQSHSSYLAAIRLAASGQIPQAQMVLRGCLENAMYAYLVFRRNQDKETWLNRAADPDKVRDRFSVTNIWRIMEHHDSKLRERLQAFYDRTIDEGAHPNVNAMKRHSYHEHKFKRIQFSLNYLHPDEIDRCLGELLEAVECALDVFDVIFDSASFELR